MSRNVIAVQLAAVACGLVMVHAAASPVAGYGTVAAVLALVAVLVSVWIPASATVAVVLVIAVVVLDDTSSVAAAVSGLAAMTFLALCHSSMRGQTGVSVRSVLTPATVVGGLSFAAVVLAATAIPVSVPWGPVLAPIIALAVFVVAIRPLVWGRSGWTAEPSPRQTGRRGSPDQAID